MNKRFLGALLAVVAFTAASITQAAVLRVYPGDSIQAAIDAASDGDTILVEPGTYGELTEDGTETYGLRITKNNLRLIGKRNKGKGKANKVRLIAYGDQKTGVYAAPKDCEFDMDEQECKDAGFGGGDIVTVKNFYIRGFSVEEFPVNGIQTRWVDGFEFVRNASVNNLNNGIYPTLSANGLVRNNVSYGSLDTAMWIAGSENVRVIGNELHSSVIGFEITVSNEVEVKQNEMYNNVVGVGLFHPNGAGNPPLPVMANWLIEQNDVYSNNGLDVNGQPIVAPPGSFQADLPPGVGVLALGVSDHVISKNNVEDHDYVGIGVLGWCTALAGGPRDCGDGSGLRWPPEAKNILVSQNYLSGNGGNPPPLPPQFLLPDVDLLYAQFEILEAGSGNCFKKNRPKNAVTSFAAYPETGPPPPLPLGNGGPLPTDGC